jgi:hypothetical protein
MTIRFYMDPETDMPHISNHAVSEEEVVYVLVHPWEDRPGKKGARVACGPTGSGRFIRVVYIIDDEGDIFVITAYDIKGKALKSLKRRRRR